MKYYKGFENDMTCRGFQYEEGKEYETDTARLCEAGFHACENPLDVLNYYDMYDDNFKERKYCTVELNDVSNDKSNDTKVVGKKIKIGAALGITGLFKAGIEFLIKTTIEDCNQNKVECGYYAKIGSSGDSAKICSSGDGAKIGSSGDSAKIGSSGDNCVVMCAGHNSTAKAKKGSWITLAEWFGGKPIHVVTKQVDGEEIKEDTLYKLIDGKFTEV